MQKETFDYFSNHSFCFRKSEKRSFAETLINKYSELGYNGVVDHRKVGWKKAQNILIGNFKTAKKVILVPYDTPKKMLWPNYKMYPQNGTLSMRKNFLPLYGPLLLAYVVLLILVYALPNFIDARNERYLLAFSMLYLVLLFVMIFRGFANRNNNVSRSNALALAYSLAENLNTNKRKEIAYIFTDLNAVKMQGSEAASAFLSESNRKPEIIVLYCIGQGDTISIAYQKGNRKSANAMAKKEKVRLVSVEASDCTQLPLEHLQNAMMISTGTIENNELCVKGLYSSKDNQCDMELLEKVETMLVEYIK